MNVKNRIALRLIAWLAAVGLVLFALAWTTLSWTMNQLSKIDATRQFESAGLHRLIQTVQAKGDKLVFDPELLDQVRESGGWLQRIDEQGEVTDSFFTPDDVPLSYGPGELTSYWQGRSVFPYQLYIWIQEKNGVVHTLLYGLSNKENSLLHRLKEQAVITGNEVRIAEDLREGLRESASWLQVLNRDGTELASLNKPARAIADYSVQELVLRSSYPDRYGARVVSEYDRNTGLTWVLSSPLSGTEPGEEPFISPENRVLLIGIGMLLLAAMLVFVFVSYWFGQRFGAPIAHVLKWLGQLGEGRYEEPADAKGIPRSLNRRGRRKRKYRVYQDVIESMDTLSRSLHANERLREETEKMRDEWIAGVSHDLKTPLSSIKGYAHVLVNDSYEWSTEEVRSFARIILDKSSYLDELINDLTLTYRLRSGDGSPVSERVNLNEYLAEAIQEAANHPMYPEESVLFVPSDTPAYMRVYKPWFQRIVDNLVANALLHNEKGTTLTVTIRSAGPNGITLAFSDDGKGMNEETASRLFERYYRGTDTESRTEGSGLGMAVTKALVEALGGAIEVVAAEGKGATILLKWKSEQLSDRN
ncbi:sensor histidine kinase [Cohnella cholangitidis]|uniref:histidine kinase n=1 Tax=Cohnella cholangitidis TaxID=2598458 RepID=A0A7G5C244_9BACL|nr:HAMP domain-containing sensor histidine kinase [Cohnella cholangitidis]QMV43278.1 HAMP domain-containing histidine kinase [Cohnella cholangitidis]